MTPVIPLKGNEMPKRINITTLSSKTVSTLKKVGITAAAVAGLIAIGAVAYVATRPSEDETDSITE